jgi:hypothetical protein
MRWLYVTLGLLSVSACLLAWVYLRDRDTNWRPPEHQLARIDAAATLNVLGGECRSGCATKLLGLKRTESHRWLMHVTVSGRTQCLQINLDTFAVSPQHGLSGVQPSRCASHPSAG